MILLAFLAWGVSPAYAQDAFKPVSTFDAPAIQGRPVELDSQGKLLPWPYPHDIGASYESYFLTQWSVLRREYHGPRDYYFFCCVDFDRSTFELIPDRHWANSTGYLRAMLEGFVEHLYPYTGDPETIRLLKDFVDYELAHGTTPRDYAWSGVPYASADPGATTYRGWSKHAVDFIEPPIVGEDGYGYLRLYEMTGEVRYLQAAIRCADALVKNIRQGDATHSPWPVRVYARTGKVGKHAMGEYSANVIEPIELFDELIRLQLGDVAGYRRVREQAWQWLFRYPMTDNVWVGYFEDVAPDMANMNNVIPLETARYLLLHPELDPHWKQDAAGLIDWVRTTPKWPKYIVGGAMVTTEQGDGHHFCCGKPNDCCDSHTARLAAIEAIYYWKTEDEDYKEQAFRSYNWVTYQQGFPPKGVTPWGQGQWWFTDEFADGPRRMMDGLWAVPEWAPATKSHFLGSTSVVTHIVYGRGSVTYATFDAAADDVLRLDFTPTRVLADGHALAPDAEKNADGYAFDAARHVLRVHRSYARNVSIEGAGGVEPTHTVDFDDPHVPAGTLLHGAYPNGIIDWGANTWRVGVPEGRFATFNLAVADARVGQADFSFVTPHALAGITVFNSGPIDMSLKIDSPPNQVVTITVPAGRLQRVQTGWRSGTLRIRLEALNGTTLGNWKFDDIRYSAGATVPEAAPDRH
ncbi:hypothetical protein B0E48_08440 [Rhodanobacter sp. C03]|nr:hypothetical protein B0E48_08440 [Rhodanobacter sp. C03]